MSGPNNSKFVCFGTLAIATFFILYLMSGKLKIKTEALAKLCQVYSMNKIPNSNSKLKTEKENPVDAVVLLDNKVEVDMDKNKIKYNNGIEADKIIIPNPDSLHLLDQTDESLISYVRAKHIFSPSTLPLNLNGSAIRKADGGYVDDTIAPLFKNKTGGIFIEVGAYDGIASHTLLWEYYHNWTGLLIECNPNLIPKLKSVHRKAFISDVCLSRDNHARKGNMTSMDSWLASSSLGKGNIFPPFKSNFTTIEVQTIPLYTIMAAVGMTVVDLIILDIQSMELFVLRNFPFHLVQVKVWVIEVVLFTEEEKKEVKAIMSKNGFSKIIPVAMDYVCVHDSMT